jgi:nicotinamidase-related amidase
MSADRDWSAFALLLIDVQRDFWTPELQKAFPQFEQNVEALLSLCRAEGIDVIHLRAAFQADRSNWMPLYKLRGEVPCVAGTPGCEPLPCAQEESREPVYHKACFDGMQLSELRTWLQGKGKRLLLVAGLETSVCVLFTAASAAQNGCLTVVVEDACADAPEPHAHTLEHYNRIALQRVTARNIVQQHERWLAQLREVTL